MDVAMLTLVAPSLLTMAVRTPGRTYSTYHGGAYAWSYLLYLPWRCVRLVVPYLYRTSGGSR